jgi:hypothetical protein
MAKELTSAHRVASEDLGKALVCNMEAKRHLAAAEKELQTAKIKLALIDAQFSMGKYGRYGRRWQNPFFAPLWNSFWFRIWRHDF